MQTSSLFAVATAVPFAGADFVEERDRVRLTTQIACILEVALDGKWRTIQRLTADLRRRFPHINFPENSVQAQLRNLRKMGYTVNRRNQVQSGVLNEYQVLQPANPGAGAAKHGGANAE